MNEPRVNGQARFDPGAQTSIQNVDILRSQCTRKRCQQYRRCAEPQAKILFLLFVLAIAPIADRFSADLIAGLYREPIFTLRAQKALQRVKAAYEAAQKK